MNEDKPLLIIIITSEVFAALISSLTNLVISLINWNQFDTMKMRDDITDGNCEEEYNEYLRKCREYILNVFIDDKTDTILLNHYLAKGIKKI